jgi:hypothetical protein
MSISRTLFKLIGEVNSFTEHVASRRSFRWCNPKTLRKDTHVVRHSTTMEKKKAVVFLLELGESFCFSFSFNLENSNVF